MYGILDRYLGRNFIVMVLILSICLTLLTGLITFIDKTRYIGRGDVDFWFVFYYLIHFLPGFMVMFFPVSVLLGAVISLGLMARNSEIIVMQSVGLSRLNIALIALKSLIPFILIIMAIGEFIVPTLETRAEARLTEVSSGNKITVSKSGIWLREGNSFIGIQSALSDGSLHNIVRYDVEDNKLIREYRAKSATYQGRNWRMEDVTVRHYRKNGVEVEFDKQQIWKLNLNPDRVNVVGNNPANVLTIKGLIDYISYLNDNKQDASRYKLQLYNKLMSPLSDVVMLMLALSTVFGPLRSMHMGTRILAGISLGFGYYVLNQIVVPFSLVYGIPPLLGASSATVIFGILAVFLLKRKV
ncbi:MAG: LPS export ABC transporter permease LptG [Succinivibrio sp.]|nr:LPS export ABC transporter permease LptG [Succinivibrio sp.]